MAISHLPFNNPPIKHGNALQSALTQLENGMIGLNAQIQTMGLMLSGDGSDPIHFNYIVNKYGFNAANGIDANAVAKAAWEELLSLQSKLNTDAQVSNVKAAMAQAFSKFR